MLNYQIFTVDWHRFCSGSGCDCVQAVLILSCGLACLPSEWRAVVVRWSRRFVHVAQLAPLTVWSLWCHRAVAGHLYDKALVDRVGGGKGQFTIAATPSPPPPGPCAPAPLSWSTISWLRVRTVGCEVRMCVSTLRLSVNVQLKH